MNVLLKGQMVNELHLYIAFLLIEHSKCFTDECLRHLPIHTPMVEASCCQSAHWEHIGWGFSVLLKDTSRLGEEESNHQPSYY